MVFSISNTFDIDEIVVVPRTRGGFSYAKVTKQIMKDTCFFDTTKEHKCLTWRVVYNSNSTPLYKDLPAPYIGKLIDSYYHACVSLSRHRRARREGFRFKRIS